MRERNMSHMKLKFFAAIVALLCLIACSEKSQESSQDASSGKAAANEPADFVFTNGKIYTVEDDNPWAEAVAVRGNKIVYVGDTAGAEELVGKGTERIDLTDKMMLPGYVSTHDHIIAAAW